MSHESDPSRFSEQSTGSERRRPGRELLDRVHRHLQEWGDRYRQMRFRAGR